MNRHSHAITTIVPLLILTVGATVFADDAGIRLLKATYKIANEKSTATSLVIETTKSDGTPRRFLVTAKHVLEGMAGDRCVIVNRIEQSPGIYARNEIGIMIRRDGQPIWRGHPNKDLAVIELPPELKLASLPYECIASENKLGEASAGESVRSAVYPERSEANPPGFAILRGGSIASFPIVPVSANPAFLVDTTTWTGDSGGPVMHAEMRTEQGDPIVLGFVRGMRNITDTTRESRFVEKRVHYPLGIAEVTPASFLLDLIPAPEPAAE
jgi:hypothetical protein